MNPARSLGPALLTGGRPRHIVWVFFVGCSVLPTVTQ